MIKINNANYIVTSEVELENPFKIILRLNIDYKNKLVSIYPTLDSSFLFQNRTKDYLPLWKEIGKTFIEACNHADHLLNDYEKLTTNTNQSENEKTKIKIKSK